MVHNRMGVVVKFDKTTSYQLLTQVNRKGNLRYTSYVANYKSEPKWPVTL
jgi:hypothetical protein